MIGSSDMSWAEDEELKAMQTVGRALTVLDREAAARVVRWAVDRFGVGVGGAARRAGPMTAVDVDPGEEEYPDIASLFQAANMRGHAENVLVVGYWLQVIKGQADLDAQHVNAELKQLGHGVRNITSTFSDLMKRKPQLVMQVKKGGASKQARKKYRLTAAGIQAVRTKVSGGGASDD